MQVHTKAEENERDVVAVQQDICQLAQQSEVRALTVQTNDMLRRVEAAAVNIQVLRPPPRPAPCCAPRRTLRPVPRLARPP